MSRLPHRFFVLDALIATGMAPAAEMPATPETIRLDQTRADRLRPVIAVAGENSVANQPVIFKLRPAASAADDLEFQRIKQ